MTVQERKMTFAYCFALECEYAMERVLDFGRESLSTESKTALVNSLEQLRKATQEIGKFMHDHTDWDEKGDTK